MKKLIHYLKKLFIVEPTVKKEKTLFAQHLIIDVGDVSADDQDADWQGKHHIISGKVKKITLEKFRSGDKIDYHKIDTIKLTPKTRTSLIKYTAYEGPYGPINKKIRLFKDFKGKKKTIKLQRN